MPYLHVHQQLLCIEAIHRTHPQGGWTDKNSPSPHRLLAVKNFAELDSFEHHLFSKIQIIQQLVQEAIQRLDIRTLKATQYQKQSHKDVNRHRPPISLEPDHPATTKGGEGEGFESAQTLTTQALIVSPYQDRPLDNQETTASQP